MSDFEAQYLRAFDRSLVFCFRERNYCLLKGQTREDISKSFIFFENNPILK